LKPRVRLTQISGNIEIGKHRFSMPNFSAAERRRLSVRRFLRNPYVTVTAYLLLMIATCAVGSITIWSSYHFWQLPSLLMGLSGNIVAFVGGIGIIHIMTWALQKPIDWKRHLRRVFRRGYATAAFIVMAAILAIAYPLLPKSESPIVGLYQDMEQTRHLLSKVKDKIAEIEKMPKYSGSQEIAFAQKILTYRLPKQHTIAEYEQFANSFYAYRDHASPHIRGWARMLAADSLDRSGQTLKAVGLYSELAQDPKASNYMRRWAYQELGFSSYAYVGDSNAAAEYWKAALKFQRSRGLLENLAQIYSDKRDWSTAESYYRQADTHMRDLMKQSKAISLRQQWAVLLVNWGNMYRLQASEEKNHFVQSQHRNLGIAKIERAKVEDISYLDIYWTGARLHIEAKNYKKARGLLDEASVILNSPEKYDLSRFSFDEIGSHYNAWVRLILHYRTSSGSNISPHLMKELDDLDDREEGLPIAIYGLLQKAKVGGMTIDEDIPILLEMASSGIIR